MPTGYTADIPSGITFTQFALNCARSFGALISLRDNPKEQIPDEIRPNQYHKRAMVDLQNELKALHTMSDKELEQASYVSWIKEEEIRTRILEEIRQRRKAYERMLAKVNAWTPPTPDHFALKTFMIKQIEESIQFDCTETYYLVPKTRMSGREFYLQRESDLVGEIEHHEREHKSEVAIAARNTAWIKALRESLPPEESFNEPRHP